MDVFERNGSPEEAFSSASLLGNKIVEVYLPWGSVSTVADDTKDSYSIITNFKKAGDSILVNLKKP